MKIKFEIGQKVKIKSDGEIGKVLGFSVNASGVVYQISSQEVDIKRKELIQGIKTLTEDELEAVKEND